MMHLNRIQLIGRVGGDVDYRQVNADVSVASASLATSERYRDKNGEWQDGQTHWHRLIFWRNLADRAASELSKGALVFVEGKVEYRSWEDQNGNKRYNTDIVVTNFRCLEPPPRRDNLPDTPPPMRNYSNPSSQTASETQEDDGLPF